MWGDCVYDEKSSVVVGNLMGNPNTETNGVYLLNSEDDVTSACYFTTDDIKFDALHEVDKEMVELEKWEKELENGV